MDEGTSRRGRGLIWVVDTCVIIDLVERDSEFSAASAAALASKFDDSFMIAPITYVELAPVFDGDSERQNAFLKKAWIDFDFAGNDAAVIAAHRAWYEHVLRKRTGAEQKRPIADIMIGAYAMQKGGLITRNEDDFRALFPNLTIFNPVAAAT